MNRYRLIHETNCVCRIKIKAKYYGVVFFIFQNTLTLTILQRQNIRARP